MIKKISKIVGRLAVATFLISLFFILTQNFQIFPGLVPGLSEEKGVARANTPADVTSHFAKTADGELIEVWHMPCGSKTAGKPAVAIFFHGNAENLPSAYLFQRWLCELGISNYSFDYRGFGRSSGWPSEQGLYADAEAVYQLVTESYNSADTEFIFIGQSIGSGIAAYLAAQHHPDKLLLMSPYKTLRELVRELPVFGYLAPFLCYDLPTIDYLRSLKDTKIILVHGANDRTIPSSHTELMARALSQTKELTKIVIPDAGHNDLFGRGLKEIERALSSRFDN